ncbi:MAG: Gfo/Idh/MocA family oxidoreductase [Kiritimatiellae bacterium]|nr:Gfo/Idh/MocA family oxidoreductase [Kiritimatiellia bacterium]
MRMDPLRIGMIGCGENAKKGIVTCIAMTKLARVVATMDVRLDLAKDLADEAGIGVYTDNVDVLLRHREVEAVVISTPHNLHVPLGIKAARMKKHVLVDKPVATTVRDAERFIAACRREGVLLSVLFGKRFGADMEIAAALVRRGVLGRLTGFSLVNVRRKADSYWTGGYTNRVKTDWRTRKKTAGGGMLLMNYSHNLDAIQNLLGLEPESVYAQHDTFATPVEVEDYFSVLVRYKGGAIGTFLGSSATPGGLKTPDCLYGTHGTITVDGTVRYFTRKRIKGLRRGEWADLPLERGSHTAGMRLIENFARAVRGKEDLIVTGENAVSSLRVIEAAYASQKSGRPVVFT